MDIQELAEGLQTNFVLFLKIFIGIWTGLFVTTVALAKGWLPVLATFILPPIIFELTIRVILRKAYGSQYQYSLFSYFLMDHPVYGNAFRPNTYSRSLSFPVFDKFVFRSDERKAIDYEVNRQQRLEFNINSLGFRGKEFSRNTKGGKLRIFCSGGSTTACDCNHDHETWPAQLEQKLKLQGYDVEVINAGVEAWFSYQELLRLQKEIASYKPDVILLHQGWNEEFEYSSLNLGKDWQPRVARNAREENNLYCKPNSWYSNPSSLAIYLSAQHFLKSRVFIPNMNFANPNRWEVLKQNRYILAWFENMLDMARIAKECGSLLYTIDYPGLVGMADTYDDREYYIQHSRLTPLYADYQAISKKRITNTLKHTHYIIPCLNVEQNFDGYKEKDRIELFHDEIHMTPKGNALFAEFLSAQLSSHNAFKIRYEQEHDKSNVLLTPSLIDDVRHKLEKNPPYVDRFIDSRILRLEGVQVPASVELEAVPEDRYTTF